MSDVNNITAEHIHNKLLDMMKLFHRFCVENEITYYIIGGTALGAFRHKGFIPWDDDMDVTIPRPDYDKFISIADKLPEPLEIDYYGNRNNCPIHYVKLVDKSTTLIEQHYKNYVEGAYIDVFPLDGSKEYAGKEIKRHKKIYSLFYYTTLHQNTDKTHGLRKIRKFLISKMNLNQMHNRLHDLLVEVPFESADYVDNYLGAYHGKEITPKSYFAEPVLYQFEDTQLYGPTDMDGYLKTLYGDYMQLPPEENRVFKHNYYYLDYSQPYREYLKKNVDK